jgi:hypothetical protein
MKWLKALGTRRLLLIALSSIGAYYGTILLTLGDRHDLKECRQIQQQNAEGALRKQFPKLQKVPQGTLEGVVRELSNILLVPDCYGVNTQ